MLYYYSYHNQGASDNANISQFKPGYSMPNKSNIIAGETFLAFLAKILVVEKTEPLTRGGCLLPTQLCQVSIKRHLNVLGPYHKKSFWFVRVDVDVVVYWRFRFGRVYGILHIHSLPRTQRIIIIFWIFEYL